MDLKLNFYVIVLCIFVMQVHTSEAIPCDSCGKECANACGTKHFRTCCFNYLRKRTDTKAVKFKINQHLIEFIILKNLKKRKIYRIKSRVGKTSFKNEKDEFSTWNWRNI